MRSLHGALFGRLCDADHLDEAAQATVRGKRSREDIAWFLFRREDRLRELGDRLRRGEWRPDGFRVIRIHDPKPRIIAHASVEDRVVHAAIVRLIEPFVLRSVLPDSFACRRGFGTHRAVFRLLEFMRRHRFALHLDVRSYFPSIDVAILTRLLRDRIRDGRFLAVIDRILEAGRGLFDSPAIRAFGRFDPDWPPRGQGLPIGALTSQAFAAHLYLAAFDHFVKRTLKVPGYVRYVDDMYLFGQTRAELRHWRAEVGKWLAEERHLRLKRPYAPVLSCRGHLDALGHRVTREGIGLLPRRPLVRMCKRARRYVFGAGEGDQDVDVVRSMTSFVGGMRFGL